MGSKMKGKLHPLDLALLVISGIDRQSSLFDFYLCNRNQLGELP